MLRVHLTSTQPSYVLDYNCPISHPPAHKPPTPPSAVSGVRTVVAPDTGPPRLAAIWLTSRPSPDQPYKGSAAAISHQPPDGGSHARAMPVAISVSSDRSPGSIGWGVILCRCADVQMLYTLCRYALYDVVQMPYKYALCGQQMVGI